MDDINGDVANLSEAICTLIEAHEFGYRGRILCAKFPRRNMRRERRIGWAVLEERTEEVYV